MGIDATLSLAVPTPALHVVTDAAKSAKATPEVKAKAQAKEFEQVFLASMLNQMFAGLETTGPFHGGAFRLAIRTGTPIVPVALRGLRDLSLAQFRKALRVRSLADTY